MPEEIVLISTVVTGLLAILFASLSIWLIVRYASHKQQWQQTVAELEHQNIRQESEWRAGQKQIIDLHDRLRQLEQEKLALNDLLSTGQQRVSDLKSEVAQWRTRYESQQSIHEHLQTKISSLEAGNMALRDQKEILTNEMASLNSSIEEKISGLKAQQQHFEEGRQKLVIEFQHLANEILEQKSIRFTETNKQSLDQLLQPFKLQMDQFRAKIEDIHHKDSMQQAELKSEMVQLRELNKQMTEEAHQLATALKGQKKMQGNWGELVLENILDRSGLRQGEDYRREVVVQGESGNRQRPDAVVYLPGKKHLIIDAKVSLNAYTRYVNADDDATRSKALAEHVAAFSQRIKELSARDYFKSADFNSPDMVVMFVPVESAFVEAFKSDEHLFQLALDQNVLIATPTTLMTSLNMVRQLWRFEDQNKNITELVRQADGIYSKLRTFLSSFQGVRKSLDKALEEYSRAENQLISGRGNLIKRAEEFKRLAPTIQGELPSELVEKADLEIELPPRK